MTEQQVGVAAGSWVLVLTVIPPWVGLVTEPQAETVTESLVVVPIGPRVWVVAVTESLLVVGVGPDA